MFCLSPDPYQSHQHYPGMGPFLEQVLKALDGNPQRTLLRRFPHMSRINLHPHGWALFPLVRKEGRSADDRIALLPLFHRKTPVRFRLPWPVDQSGFYPLVHPLPSPDPNTARWLVLARTPDTSWVEGWTAFRIEGRREGRGRVHVDVQPLFYSSRLNVDFLLPLTLNERSIRLLGVREHLEFVDIVEGVLPVDPVGEGPDPTWQSMRVFHFRYPEGLARPHYYPPPMSMMGFQWPHPGHGLLAFSVGGGKRPQDNSRVVVVPVVHGRIRRHAFILPPKMLAFPLKAQDDEYIYWGRFVYHIPTGRGGRLRFAPEEPSPPESIAGYHGRRLYLYGRYSEHIVWLALPRWDAPGWGELIPNPVSDLEVWGKRTPAVRWPLPVGPHPLLAARLHLDYATFLRVLLTSVTHLRQQAGLPLDGPSSRHLEWEVFLEEVPTTPLDMEPLRPRRVDPRA